MVENTKRTASFAGSWYTGDKEELDQQLNEYLQKAQKELVSIKTVKAVIAPHAGYLYSGPTAAWSYQYLQAKNNLRVFLLGPSHRKYFPGAGLTKLSSYETPLGDITIDTKTVAELRGKGNCFQDLDKNDEEGEHSLEMHLPYIQKMLGSQQFQLVPIMVGQTDQKTQQKLGEILAPYFDDENTIFCVSSDFCHWGSRFSYQYQEEEDGEIWQSIEKLDKKGMDIIAEQNNTKFTQYLEQTQNTICGRNPISVLLQIINQSQFKQQLKTFFVKYDQSSKCKNKKDSSVSYASAITYIPV